MTWLEFREGKDIDHLILFTLGITIYFERLLLFSREQKQNESLEFFYNSLSELAKTCDLGTLEASLVKDLFLAKMNNKEMQDYRKL